MRRDRVEKWGVHSNPSWEFEEYNRTNIGYALSEEFDKLMPRYVIKTLQFVDTCPLGMKEKIGLGIEEVRAIHCQKSIVMAHWKYPTCSEATSSTHEYEYYEFLFLLRCIELTKAMLEEACAYRMGGITKELDGLCLKILRHVCSVSW